jgi:DNA-binding GntR family transcriptional regulator
MTASATRAEMTAQIIRGAIQDGLYMGGERLIEQALAGQMNVSQNTIRDALRILEGEGWVVKTARYGVHVRSFTPAEAEELYALWAAVEGLALRWTMDALTKQVAGQLRRLIQEARKQALTDDTKGASETLFTLHAHLAALCGKAQTIELLASLRNRVRLLDIVRQMRAPRSLRTLQAQIILYEKLLSLMEAGEADDAVQLHYFLIMEDCATLLPLLDQT